MEVPEDVATEKNHKHLFRGSLRERLLGSGSLLGGRSWLLSPLHGGLDISPGVANMLWEGKGEERGDVCIMH